MGLLVARSGSEEVIIDDDNLDLSTLFGGLTSWVSVGAPPYSAQGDNVTDDTAAIQAALTAAALSPMQEVFLPPGTFLVDGTLAIRDAVGVRFFGPGTLKLKEGSTGPAALRLINSRHCRVQGIRVDGSHEYTHNNTAAGIQINADSFQNLIEDTYVFNTRKDTVASGGPADGEGYLVLGSYNTLLNVRSYDCDYAAASISGAHNLLINPQFYATGLTRGDQVGVRALLIDGNYIRIYGGVIDQSLLTYDSTTLGHACVLADPNPNWRDSLYIEGLTCIGGANAGSSGGNVMKFALVKAIYLNGVRCINNNSQSSIRIAEKVERFDMRYCELDGGLFKENNNEGATPEMKFFYAENNKLGLNATYRPSDAFSNMRAKRLEFVRNEVHGNRFANMDVTDANLEQCIFDDNDFYGYSDGVSPASNVFVNVSDSGTMMIGSGKYIYLPNNKMTAMGAGANFTGGNAGKRQLLSTIDRTGRNFEQAAAPVDSAVSWRLRDRVFSTATPAAGNPDFWICKVAGVGGTGGQWQAHNL